MKSNPLCTCGHRFSRHASGGDLSDCLLLHCGCPAFQDASAPDSGPIAAVPLPPRPGPPEDATPRNEGAYRQSARRLGEFEPVPLEEIAQLPDPEKRAGVDPRIGSTIAEIMRPGEGGARKTGGGSRSGRKAPTKDNKPTERQAAEATLRRDQEADFISRSSWVAGRVTPAAHDALIAEGQKSAHSVGTIMQILGEAIMSGSTFEEIEARIRARARTPDA